MNAKNANGFLIDTAAYKLPESYQHLRDFRRQVGMDECRTETSATSSSSLEIRNTL